MILLSLKGSITDDLNEKFLILNIDAKNPIDLVYFAKTNSSGLRSEIKNDAGLQYTNAKLTIVLQLALGHLLHRCRWRGLRSSLTARKHT